MHPNFETKNGGKKCVFTQAYTVALGYISLDQRLK